MTGVQTCALPIYKGEYIFFSLVFCNSKLSGYMKKVLKIEDRLNQLKTRYLFIETEFYRKTEELK